jgi:hypothetical protein
MHKEHTYPALPFSEDTPPGCQSQDDTSWMIDWIQIMQEKIRKAPIEH